MNTGLAIFKKRQRLQGGTDKVRFPRRVPPPTLMSTWGDYFAALIEQAKQDQIDPDMIWNPPTERPPDEGQRERFQGGVGEVRGKEPPFAEGGKWWWEIGDEQAKLDDEQGHDADLAHLTPDEQAQEQLDWNENIKSILAITPNLDAEERRQVLELNPKDWDDSTREKVGQASEMAGKGMQLARGTSNVQHFQGGMELVNKLGYNPSYPYGDFGSGVPTQKGVGAAGSFLGNLLFPGLGFLTGPLAKWAFNALKGGMPLDQVKQAVQQQQEQPESPVAPAPAPPTTQTTPSAGVGIDPWGNPADPGEWWSNDFGRWLTDQYGTTPGNYNLLGPGGQFGVKGLGSSGFGGTVGTRAGFSTAIGFGGPYGGGIGAGDVSRFRGQAGYSHPYTEAQYNTPTTHFGWEGGQPSNRASYEQYLNMFHAPGTVGSSTGLGGAAAGGIGSPQGGMKAHYGHTPKLSPFAMGTSDVNPGLKFYQKKLFRKKKS